MKTNKSNKFIKTMPRLENCKFEIISEFYKILHHGIEQNFIFKIGFS